MRRRLRNIQNHVQLQAATRSSAQAAADGEAHKTTTSTMTLNYDNKNTMCIMSCMELF